MDPKLGCPTPPSEFVDAARPGNRASLLLTRTLQAFCVETEQIDQALSTVISVAWSQDV